MNDIERGQIQDLRRHIDERINVVIKFALVGVGVLISSGGGLLFYLSAEQDRTTVLEGRQAATEAITERNDRDIGLLQQQASDMRMILGRVEEQIRGQSQILERIEKRLDRGAE